MMEFKAINNQSKIISKTYHYSMTKFSDFSAPKNCPYVSSVHSLPIGRYVVGIYDQYVSLELELSSIHKAPLPNTGPQQ